ncbi:hypothetical protein ABEF95_017252 [Exophiala dermatitidis]
MPRDRRRSHDSGEEDQYIILVKDIPRHCRWQELKDMTRSYGGEHSLKAEVFELGDGSQMGHCTVKGKTAATQVYEKFCKHGWNGQCVCVSLAVLEKPGVLKTIQGPRRSRGGAHTQTNRTPTHVAISGAPGVVTSMLPSHSQYANTSNPTEQIMRGKCKGTARARYKTMSEALSAARSLDGQTLAGRRIAVKQVNNDDAAALTAMARHTGSGSSKKTTTTVADARKGSVPSTSAPPLLKQKSSNAQPLHKGVSGSSSSKALSSSAPPKLSSTGRPNAGRGSASTSTSNGTSTGSGSTSPVGPLVVNGATYSRRPSRKDDTSGSDDSSEDETAESEDDEDQEAGSSNDGDEREYGYRGSVSRTTGMVRRMTLDRHY